MPNRIRLSHFVNAIACLAAFLGRTALSTSAADTVPTTSTGFEEVHVVELPKQIYGYRGAPGSMVELKDGRLLLTYTRMDANGHSEDAIAARFSSDQGKTWSDESVLVPKPKPHGKDRYCHPSLLRLANGQLLLSYIYVSGAEPLFGHNYYRRSEDDGHTWGDQLIVTPCAGYHIMHNDKLLQLASGRILAPVEHEFVNSANDHAGYVSGVFYSDDNGYSWHPSQNWVNLLPVEAQEPHLVELKDGRLLMLMRTYHGCVARSYSLDKGQTWSKGELVRALTLTPSDTSALNIKRIPTTGDLLLIRCTGGPKTAPRRRTPMVSAISKDEGATWIQERIIGGDPEDDYGYPSLTFTGNLAVLSYHQRDGLHVARIGIAWFYGK